MRVESIAVGECPFCLASVLKTGRKGDKVEILGDERGMPYYLAYESTLTPVYYHTIDRCASRRAWVDKIIAENAKKERQS